jgi:Phosphotransferase enzyme family
MRPPLPSGSGLGRAALHAIRRTTLIATVRARSQEHFQVTRVHQVPPPRSGAGRIRRRLRRLALGGVAIEFWVDRPGVRVLDAVCDGAGLHGTRTLRIGSGGAASVVGASRDGQARVVRVARSGDPADPAKAADALELLRSATVPLVPRLIDRGRVGAASWTAESVLEGARADRLTGAVGADIVGLLASLPRAEGPPTSLAEDLRAIGDLLPTHAVALNTLARDFLAPELPAIMRHGDLWVGNLLVRRGRLAGVVDWDAWHPRGVPGADLLELYASVERMRRRRPLGEAWRERPWRSEGYTNLGAGYWRATGIRPTQDQLEIVGIAWWATKVAGTLQRLPDRARDDRWVAEIVDPVIDALHP